MTRLSDAQYAALDAAAHRGDTHIYAGQDATDATMRALAKQGYGTLEYGDPNRPYRPTALRISNAGKMARSDEADLRAATAARKALDARLAASPAIDDALAPFVDRRQAAFDARVDAAFAN